MLHDEDRIALIAQPFQRIDQLVVVDRMEADRRLIEDVDRAHKARADLRRKPDPLRFAAAQSGRRPIEGEIRESDIDQKLNLSLDLFQQLIGDFHFQRGSI